MVEPADFDAMLSLLVGMRKAVQPSERHDPLPELDVFVDKIMLHAASARTVKRGVQLPGAVEPGPYPDAGGVLVLARATWEAFLLFSYFFSQSGGSSPETLARFDAYALEGAIRRQRFPATDPQTLRKKAREREFINQRKARLRANRFFCETLQADERRAWIKWGKWRPGWERLGELAGIGSMLAKHFYSFMCSWAHTGSNAILMLGNLQDGETHDGLSDHAMDAIMIALANSVSIYAQHRPSAEAHLASTRLRPIVTMWIEIGRGLHGPPPGSPADL